MAKGKPPGPHEAKLKAMFKDLEARPVPNTINSLVDQLRAGEVQPAPQKGRRGG
jgi:hypothetical protein